MDQKWQHLENSYWFVPVPYLPALQMNAEDTEPTFMIDQTVWQITGYRDGYFWGNCAALIYEKGTTPANPPEGKKLVGTITPEGQVLITFMSISEIGAAQAIQGWGKMMKKDGRWVFEMQMSSGVTYLVAHWADMALTQPGDPSWEQLPGTDYSVPAFLEAAGF